MLSHMNVYWALTCCIFRRREATTGQRRSSLATLSMQNPTTCRTNARAISQLHAASAAEWCQLHTIWCFAAPVDLNGWHIRPLTLVDMCNNNNNKTKTIYEKEFKKAQDSCST